MLYIVKNSIVDISLVNNLGRKALRPAPQIGLIYLSKGYPFCEKSLWRI